MEFILYIPLLLFSIIVHEFSHGYIAYKHGDDTAYLSGRLTFNPISHIDPVGTIAIPLICYFSGLPIFGWAKPVPVNPYRMRDREKAMIKVAAAGPASNILLAIVAVIIFKLLISFHLIGGGQSGIMIKLIWYFISLNIILAIFNLIPIPPLDGSQILSGLLPYHLSVKYRSFSKYGFFLLIVLLMTGLLKYVLLAPFYFIIKIIETFLGL